ncbi:hypothetical protein [Sphingomonas sp.]|uniref:hypothetical protein n=1 Tax=Sphingomonas sp. TaxID=28214 RepID=UPI0035A98488
MKDLGSYPTWILVALGIISLVLGLVSSFALGTNGLPVGMGFIITAIILITSPLKRSKTK